MMKKILAALLMLLCLTGAALAAEPELTFNLGSGFYDDPVTLEMSCTDPRATIYYTLDGSTPDETSLVYESPLSLADSSRRTDVLTRITGINSAEDYIPTQDFPTAHVVRAAAITPKGEKSAVASGTYFVGYDREALYGDTAIMCLVTDPDNLFDPEKGIYVLGNIFEQWAARQTEAFEDWQAVGNFTQHGAEWERPVSVTYLPAKGEGFTQDMGVRIKGGASRGYAQKSLRLIARKDYGDKNVNCAIYPDNLREADGGVVDKYKSFTLRSGGNDSFFSKIRDPYINNLATGLRFDTAQNMPCVAFINGEYWGLYTLNEEYTDNYIQYHYGIDNENVVMVKCGELDEGTEEDFELFTEMFDFVAWEDMTDPDTYARACEMLDMGSFADYWAVQLYIANEDGPLANNNWQMWRARTPDTRIHAYGDGKWRMMLYDTDYSSGVYSSGGNTDWDTIAAVLAFDDYESEWNPTLMLQNLLQNEDFRLEFIRACCDVRGIYFNPARTASVLTDMTAQYLTYAADSLRRFGPQWVTWNAEGHLQSNLDNLGKFFRSRAMSFTRMVGEAFDLGEPVAVNIRIKGEGEIFLNGRSVPVTNNARLETFPICGLTAAAVPAEGASFAGWTVSSGDAQLSDPDALTTEITFGKTFTLTATFE